MKKLLFILLTFIFVTVGARAQNLSFDAFYSKYESRENFTSVELSGEMVGLMEQFSNSMSLTFPKSAGFEKIRILISSEYDADFIKDMNSLGKNSYFNLLSSMKEGTDRKIELYSRERTANKRTGEKYISEFLMLVFDNSENMVVHISGRIDLQGIRKLSD